MQQILIDDAAVLIDGYYNSSMIYSKNVGYAKNSYRRLLLVKYGDCSGRIKKLWKRLVVFYNRALCRCMTR